MCEVTLVLKIIFIVLIIIVGVAVGFSLAGFMFNAQANQDIEDRDVLVRHTVTHSRHNTTAPNLIIFKQDSINVCLLTVQSTTPHYKLNPCGPIHEKEVR